MHEKGGGQKTKLIDSRKWERGKLASWSRASVGYYCPNKTVYCFLNQLCRPKL